MAVCWPTWLSWPSWAYVGCSLAYGGLPYIGRRGLPWLFVGLRWLSWAYVGRRGLSWAYVGHCGPTLAVRWPTVACVGCSLAYGGLRWLFIGLRGLLWAYVGRRGPWAYGGLRTCVDCRGLALAFVGLPGLGL